MSLLAEIMNQCFCHVMVPFELNMANTFLFFQSNSSIYKHRFEILRQWGIHKFSMLLYAWKINSEYLL